MDLPGEKRNRERKEGAGEQQRGKPTRGEKNEVKRGGG
jgi:hypothetical protein